MSHDFYVRDDYGATRSEKCRRCGYCVRTFRDRDWVPATSDHGLTCEDFTADPTLWPRLREVTRAHFMTDVMTEDELAENNAAGHDTWHPLMTLPNGRLVVQSWSCRDVDLHPGVQ